MRKLLLSLLGGAAMFSGGGVGLVQPAFAQPDAGTSGVQAVQARCGALRSAELLSVPDAPTVLLNAEVVPAAKGAPIVCQVTGRVNGAVGFILKLPASGWNGKFAHAGSQFMHVGCTGSECGAPFSADECDTLLGRGYACIVDDAGHRTAINTAAWARGDLAAKIDFAFRGVHLATLAGKTITERFYGRAPAYSYFLGCGAAGRQAMMEAQKFPVDYDGIVAGAPAIHYAANAMRVAWNAAALLDADGHSLFPAPPNIRFMQSDLQLLRKSRIEQCDMDDGAKDGMIADPRTCRFDPAKLQCKGSKTATCLSADQVAAVQAVYAGPRGRRGEALSSLRPMPGSEGNWAYSYLMEGGGPDHARALRDGLIEEMGLAAGRGAKAWREDWPGDFQRVALQAALYDASNPDLRAFKANGGKLIAFQGWSDHEVLPENIVDYYETATRTMGGRTSTQDFFRLFMIPGMDHCGNGAAAEKIEYLAALEAWVEHKQPPARLMAYERAPSDDGRYNTWPAQSGYWLTKPWDKALSAGSRPIFPYPSTARYKGSGVQTEAANWVEVRRP